MTLRGHIRTALLAVGSTAALLGATALPVLAESVLKVRPHADLKVIDPIATTAYISRNHGYMVYDTLFAQDDDLNVQPQMVDTWQVSDDKLTWTFVLRDGLRFHDGQPVTAADVVASLTRWGARDGLGQKMAAATDRMEAVDAKTVRLVLKEPFGVVLAALSKLSSNVPFVMPKRIAETDPSKNIEDATGSGPFVFRKDMWKPGSQVVYSKFGDYRPRSEPASNMAGGKVAHFDRVEWHYIPDDNTAMNAIFADEIDYFENPTIDLLGQLEADPNVRVVGLVESQGWMGLNSLYPPFDNVKARRAMQMLVDQEQYLLAAIGNPKHFRTCGAIYVCGTPMALEAGSEWVVKGDVERARQLFAEAGYKGEPIVLMHPTDIPSLNAFSLVTAELMRQAGLNVDLQSIDWSTVVARRAKQDPPKDGGWNIFHTQWIAPDVWDPALNRATLAGGKEKGWFGWYDNPEMEKLSAAYVRADSDAERKRIATELQRLWMETVPVAILGQFSTVAAVRKELTGLIESPVPVFWNVSRN